MSPDCEAPLKKEGGLPEGPVLEALLCAETGEKKVELKEEETIMDCQVRLSQGTLVANSLIPATCTPCPWSPPSVAVRPPDVFLVLVFFFFFLFACLLRQSLTGLEHAYVVQAGFKVSDPSASVS